MKRLVLAAFAAFMAAAIPAAPVFAAVTGNINGLLGLKQLDDDEDGGWGELDSQLQFGVQSDFRGENWPISLAADLLFSADSEEEDDVEVTGSTYELGLGVRKNFEELGRVVPFVGAGPALIGASLEASQDAGGGTVTFEDDDTSIGYWLGGGVLFRVTDRFNLGFNVRYSAAEVELFEEFSDEKIEAGGLAYGILAGVHF